MGTVVANRLRAEGYSVRVFSRRASEVDLASGIDAYDGDIRDANALTNALTGAATIVHLAGILRESGRNQTFEGVFLEGTRAVIEAARGAGVHRLIHVTGMGADSESPDAFERTRGQAEGETRGSGLDWTILRPSVIFGVRGSMFDRMGRSIRLTWPFAIVPAKNGLFQPIWRDDAATCVVAALHDHKTLGGVYELGGPDIWSYTELVRLAMRQLNLRRTLLRLPTRLLLTGAYLPRLLGRPPLVTRSELRQLTMDNRTDPEVMRTVFGVAPTGVMDRPDEVFHMV